MDDSRTQRRTAFIKSYGCQMNAYDATRMEELLAAEGYGLATGPESADLVILNTCHIREKASEHDDIFHDSTSIGSLPAAPS